MALAQHLRDQWRLVRSCLMVAGLNLAQHRMRMIAGVMGASVALLLLLLQISFLDAVRQKVTLLYDYFDFDLALISQNYQFLASAERFDRVRLLQAEGATPIAESFALNIDTDRWTNLATLQRTGMLVFGVDPTGVDFIADRSLGAAIGALTNSHSVLVDAFSSPDFGNLATGTKGKIGKQEVVISGHFDLGLFFYEDGAAIVRNVDFPQMVGQPSGKISLGLLRLEPGADAIAAKKAIAAALPSDVSVVTRDELIDQERRFFLSTKPIGIMLETGMLVAAVVGGVMLFQVLSTEAASRVNEYAVMKAMGFGRRFLYGIISAQMAILALGSFLPTMIIGGAILWVVRDLTHLPTGITLRLAVEMFAVAMAMCVGCGAGTLHRLWRADAADLY
jgi:putative ABC transport system permease protein